MDNTSNNRFILLCYNVNGTKKYYLTLVDYVNIFSNVNITNTKNGIQIINMPGQPPSQDDKNFIIVTSGQPPDDDSGNNAIRIPIIPVSAESDVDNILSLARFMLLQFKRFSQSIDIDDNELRRMINDVIDVVKQQKGGRRHRRSSSARRGTKKRASSRRQRHSRRRRAH